MCMLYSLSTILYITKRKIKKAFLSIIEIKTIFLIYNHDLQVQNLIIRFASDLLMVCIPLITINILFIFSIITNTMQDKVY